MAGHVAQRAGAEIEPSAPLERLILGMVGPIVCRAKELVPADVVRYAGRLLEPAQALRPDRPVGPDVNFLDRSESPRANELDTRAEPILGGPLVAHLGAELFLGGQGTHHASFLDRPGQR